MLKAYLDGDFYTYLSRPDDIAPLAHEIGVEPSRLAIDETDLEDYASDAQRRRYRASIADTAGDTETLLGTTADGSAIALTHLARLAQGLATAQSLAEMRAAAQPFADLTAQFIAAIDAGAVRLPHEAKGGVSPVLDEIGTRLTKVADVFQSQSPEA